MQTKDLKVYQDTVEFCKVLHRLTRNFPRFEKYSKIHPKSKTQEHTEFINIKYQ